MMKMALMAGLILVAATVSEAQGVPPPNKLVAVTDPQYEMTAMRMSIPTGWRFAGTVARPQGCHANGPALKFTAASPDGSMGFSQMPGVQWTTEQRGLPTGCTAVKLQSASDFLVNIAAPNLRPGSLVTAVLPATPEKAANLAQLEQQRNAALNRMAAQYGQRNSSSFRAEGARVRVKYEAGGRPMEAQINAAVNCTDGDSPMGGPTRTCTVEAISIGYAPAGQLDTLLQSAFYTNIGREAQVNPQWEQRVANESNAKFQGMMAGNAANQRNIMARGEAAGQARQQEHAANMQQQADRAATQQKAAQAQKQLYADHNNAEAARQDAVHGQAQQVIRYAGDQALFQDPNTGRQIQANSSYNHQWMSGDGQTLLQTNDHTYDPNGRAGSQAWTELVPQ